MKNKQSVVENRIQKLESLGLTRESGTNIWSAFGFMIPKGKIQNKNYYHNFLKDLVSCIKEHQEYDPKDLRLVNIKI